MGALHHALIGRAAALIKPHMGPGGRLHGDVSSIVVAESGRRSRASASTRRVGEPAQSVRLLPQWSLLVNIASGRLSRSGAMPKQATSMFCRPAAFAGVHAQQLGRCGSRG